MGVRAGDDSPSKRDRQPLFLPILFSQCTRLLLPRKRQQESVAPYALSQQGPPVLSVDSCQVHAQIPTRKTAYYLSWTTTTSVYLLANFVNLQLGMFSNSIALLLDSGVLGSNVVRELALIF